MNWFSSLFNIQKTYAVVHHGTVRSIRLEKGIYEDSGLLSLKAYGLFDGEQPTMLSANHKEHPTPEGYIWINEDYYGVLMDLQKYFVFGPEKDFRTHRFPTGVFGEVILVFLKI